MKIGLVEDQQAYLLPFATMAHEDNGDGIKRCCGLDGAGYVTNLPRP